MIAEQVFHQLLNLGECWEVKGVDYEDAANRFVLVLAETQKLMENLFGNHGTYICLKSPRPFHRKC